jgi:hypothetical protein
MIFVDLLVESLKSILSPIKKVELPRPPMLTPSIKGAFHLALIGSGWNYYDGRYQKQGHFSNRPVQMADAIRSEKRIG